MAGAFVAANGVSQQRADAASLVLGVHRNPRRARADVGPADQRAVVVLDDEDVALD